MSETLTDSCFHCGSQAAEFACSRCLQVRFCGPECQKSAWRRHRADCRKTPVTEDTGASAKAANPASLPPTRASLQLEEPLSLVVYPNVGRLQGEVEVALPVGIDFPGAKQSIARAVYGPDFSPNDFCLVTGCFLEGSWVSNSSKIESLADLIAAVAAGSKTPPAKLVAVSNAFDGNLRSLKSLVAMPKESAEAAERGARRYDSELLNKDAEVPRIDAQDAELDTLLRCQVPLIIANSNLLGDAPQLWNFEYLEKHMSDVDNFFVLKAPASSKGRFGYYDMSEKKNPCNYPVTKSNERLEMRFPEFRQTAQKLRQEKRTSGKAGGSLYLQSALLHRAEEEDCPPKPVGSFGVRCAVQVATDIRKFQWKWLRQKMAGRHVQTCQLFCGQEGDFSPCHYDPQDNIFGQVRGHKRVLLFHPKHFGSLYPWPVNHPQDRQSRVDFEYPDLKSFPEFQNLRGQGLEAILGPGDLLHLPSGWWHHIEMLPSDPNGEVVSINFWYPAPKWFYGNLEEMSLDWDRPLSGFKRVLFQRCVEDLMAQLAGAQNVEAIVRSELEGAEAPKGVPAEATQALRDFVRGVFPDDKNYRQLLHEIISGRFLKLKPQLA